MIKKFNDYVGISAPVKAKYECMKV